MSQSTQIILKKNYLDKPSETLVYHCSWGIGRIMPALFMSLVFDMQYNAFGKNGGNIKNVSFNNLERYPDGEVDVENKDIWNSSLIRDCKNGWENNNGFMIIEMDERNMLCDTKIKVGFVQGTEQKPFGAVKFLPFSEWYKPWEEEYGTDFKDCFNSFCKAFEIEQA